MRLESWAGLRVRVAGGTDREGGGDGAVVVLMHGFGAGGDDLVGLWRALDVPRELRFVFPEAPLALAEFGPGARAWWRIDFEARGDPRRDRSGEDPPGMAEAHARVVALLDEVERELGVTGDALALGGFSQGAMLACDVALRTPRPLAALVLLSGTLLARDTWAPAMSARSALPVFQSHGRQDPLLPFGAALELRDLWREAGAAVEWVEFNGGHEISHGVVERLGAFLSARPGGMSR